MDRSTPAIHPPTSLRPTNISERPQLGGTIYVETAMPEAGPSSAAQPNMNDVAGVLRRNQACLNCRRRKLKCSAERPHCATCVRSYNHLLKTAPKSNPQMNCVYDDGTGPTSDHSIQIDARAASVDEEETDVAGAKKKKRKATGETKKRNKKDDEDDETERLRKKIEALEAQLAGRQDSPPAPPLSSVPMPQDMQQPQQQRQQQQQQQQPQQQSWTQPSAFGNTDKSAPSPTAFLEMLSSAASAQATSMSDSSNQIPGLRSGASENAMMSTTYAATPKDSSIPSTGLTPFLSFVENQQAQLASDQRPQMPEKHSSTETAMSGQYDSCRSSAQASSNSFAMNNEPPAAMMSPVNFLNFSPAPPGPSASVGENLNWPPMVGSDGLQPSNRTEGPWRAVETAENTFPLPNNWNVNGSIPVMNDNASGANTGTTGFFGPDEALQQQLLMDLFWPGWPINMPEPNIVNDLVESFFNVVPNMPRLLHKGRIMTRLALPPTHSNFPHPSLLHAICAASASWCNPQLYEGSTRGKAPDYPMFGPAPTMPAANDKMGFALRQAAFGKDAVQDGLNTGNRLFDVVRAMIILSRVFIDDTRMLECWAYSGLVARMILPLGLNVRSAELSLKSVMLPPPSDALEREERRVTVWMAFYHDTIASSASGWGTSMSLEELTVPLPVSKNAFNDVSEKMEPNPQDMDSADFWTRHPVVDSFVLVIKASILINRVNRFVRKWKNRHIREEDDLDGMHRPEFRELANAIACFQMSFPAALRNPAKLDHQRKLDIDLISAHMLPHAAVICLYEPFADINDPNDAPARRIVSAAQQIVAIIQQIATASTTIIDNLSNVMHSSASVCLVTAARTILLFYRHALNMQDHPTAESHRMDIEMIRVSLQSWGQKFKIGHHHSQLIEYFLDRATHPTYEKLMAHYPTHPRGGAPELHQNSDFGVAILSALNIKRGYWKRVPGAPTPGSAGISPFGSTPESANYASSTAGHGRPPSSGESIGDRSAASRNTRLNTDSPAGLGSVETSQFAFGDIQLKGLKKSSTGIMVSNSDLVEPPAKANNPIPVYMGYNWGQSVQLDSQAPNGIGNGSAQMQTQITEIDMDLDTTNHGQRYR